MQSVSAPREPTQPVISTSSTILNMREKEKYIEDFDFPFCDESSKYEKVAKIGQGTFGEKDIDDYSDYNDNEEFDSHDDEQLKIGEIPENIASKIEITDDVVKNIDIKSDVVKNSKFESQDDDATVNSVDSKSHLENNSLNSNVDPPEESRTKTQEDILSDILEDSLPSSSEKKIVETKISDPLTDFTDVDLS